MLDERVMNWSNIKARLRSCTGDVRGILGTRRAPALAFVRCACFFGAWVEYVFAGCEPRMNVFKIDTRHRAFVYHSSTECLVRLEEIDDWRFCCAASASSFCVMNAITSDRRPFFVIPLNLVSLVSVLSVSVTVSLACFQPCVWRPRQICGGELPPCGRVQPSPLLPLGQQPVR